MRGYALPTSDGWALALLTFVVPPIVGALLLRARPGHWMRALGWALVLLAMAGGVLLTHAEPAGTRMLLVCGAVFCAMKVVVTAEARLAGRPTPTLPRWLAFHFFWPGMRPWAFAVRQESPRRGAGRLLVGGLLTTAFGLALIAAARAIGTDGARYVPAVALALVGIGFVIPFGTFRALAGFWRLRGMGVVPLFDAPQRSRSLAEFWGLRWNRAFSEMAQVALHRPLSARLGPTVAVLATFLFSGLLHELALSVPAHAGYGFPMLYFAVHGVLTLLEPRLGIRGRWGSVWTLGWVLVPVLMLFHPPFLEACIVPLLE